MNPFINPYFSGQAIKSYLSDVNRLWRMNVKRLRKYKDKHFREVVKKAFLVPLYQQKYKKAGIHPSDIKGINDIHKLPFITKVDLTRYFPDKSVSSTFNRKKAILSYTSGTTGKPVAIYFDMLTTIKELLGYVRVLREHGARWLKNRITVVVDLSENSIESEYLNSWLIPSLKTFFPINNIQLFNTYDEPIEHIEEINRFQPEFIIAYPGFLRQLAILKRKGYGGNIRPKCIVSTGAVLVKHQKEDFEQTFGANVFDAYGSMESGPIAFQCKQGNYHVHSDLVHLEFVDYNGEYVLSDEPGHIVVTRLYGEGTPIIRYTGLDDVITATDNICTCRLTSSLIEKIHGRESQSIFLPGGKVLLPSSLSQFFDQVANKCDIDKIERFQIVQHKINEIEILAAINDKIRDSVPSVENIFSTIKKSFEENFGPNIDISVKERGKFKTHEPGIISKIDISKIKKKIYI